MASLMIHLLIGQEYCKNHNISDQDAFLNGTLAPDMVKDKKPTHFSKNVRNRTFTESVLNKVNLHAFCESTDIDTDYNKGFFLHLITDQIFFHQYLIQDPRYKQIEGLNQLVIRDTLYRDYHRINEWLMNKYKDLKLDMLPEDAKVTRSDEMELLSKSALKKIIEYCSNVDLDQVYSSISEISTNAEM